MSLLAQNSSQSQKILSKIVAKTWLDEEFHSQFISNTKSVLEDNGLTLPSDVEFTVRENRLVGTVANVESTHESGVVYEIFLPTKPTGLADQPLQSWGNLDDVTSACRGSF